MTNGTTTSLSQTGTNLYFSPGLLVGGEVDHKCNVERGIGYYLEGAMMLAPFCKTPLSLKLEGVTNNTNG